MFDYLLYVPNLTIFVPFSSVPQLLSTLPHYHLCYSKLVIPSRLKAKAIKALATDLPSVNTAQGSFETLVNSDTLGFGP